MHYVDLGEARAPWGLELTVGREDVRMPARLRVEAGRRRLALKIGTLDHVLARIHASWKGLWLAVADRPSIDLLAPIEVEVLRSDRGEGAGIGDRGFLGRWTRYFAKALVAANALDEGRYALSAARDVGLSKGPLPKPDLDFDRLGAVRDLSLCLNAPTLRWESWWISGSGAVFRLRRPSSTDSGRVKAWRKRVRDGTLPPVLVMYVSGLDMFALIDGHDRLMAAELEGKSPPVLVLWKVREESTYSSERRQQALCRELALRREDRKDRRRPLDTADENALLRSAFPGPARLRATTRAYRLDDDEARWRDRVERALGFAPAEPFFSGAEPPEP